MTTARRDAMTRIKVNVTFQSGVGYVSEANPTVARSLTALSLEGLRRKVLVVAALRRRPDEEIAVRLDLDVAARAERDRRTRVTFLSPS
jgi:hypothetical protein